MEESDYGSLVDGKNCCCFFGQTYGSLLCITKATILLGGEVTQLHLSTDSRETEKAFMPIRRSFYS